MGRWVHTSARLATPFTWASNSASLYRPPSGLRQLCELIQDLHNLLAPVRAYVSFIKHQKRAHTCKGTHVREKKSELFTRFRICVRSQLAKKLRLTMNCSRSSVGGWC
jgi:hypothetical protein